MNSINEILNSRRFQSESPRRLKLLIRQHGRENLPASDGENAADRATAFSPSLPSDRFKRENFQPDQTITESKKKNAA